MTGASWDPDLAAARDPRVPPQVLSDIAARRWDLHGVILASPSIYPELAQWIGAVNPGALSASPAALPVTTASEYPASAYPISSGSTPPVPPRRSRAGCWIAGCGCLALVGAVIVIGTLLGAVGAALPSGAPGPQVTGGSSQESENVAEHLRAFEADRTRYYELLTALDGNPVAPLVSQLSFMQRVEREAAVPNLSEIAARSVAQQARSFREELEAEVAAAESRRANASGTVTEQLIDEAGDGFIDVVWDAATACTAAEEGYLIAGCVRGGDPLTVHLQAEGEFSGDWERRMLVAHELAHVYQAADSARFDDGVGSADELVEQGLFQGSDEKMADCYALTYYGEWTLQNERTELGYGYVCGEAERQAIREWAAEIHAPMP